MADSYYQATRIASRGYTSETHRVTTKDGYILNIFRIPASPRSPAKSNKPVVFLMHGFVSSSDCWVLGGPGYDLAFALADKGYDVWLGNARGTTYGRAHTRLKPKNRSFWKFSWHEIGAIDLPDMIDYILGHTKQTDLHYVGHSQGTTVFLVFLSEYPEYNRQIKTSHLLAPVSFLEHSKSLFIQISRPFVGDPSPLSRLLCGTEFLSSRILSRFLNMTNCHEEIGNESICSSLLYMMGGASERLNEDLLPAIYQTHPSSCSTCQALHFAQLYDSHKFRYYDNGGLYNYIHYRDWSPPDYRLDLIKPKLPVYLYYSKNDIFSTPEDVEKLKGKLKCTVKSILIPDARWSHIDFVFGMNLMQVLNDQVVQTISDAEAHLQQLRA